MVRWWCVGGALVVRRLVTTIIGNPFYWKLDWPRQAVHAHRCYSATSAMTGEHSKPEKTTVLMLVARHGMHPGHHDFFFLEQGVGGWVGGAIHWQPISFQIGFATPGLACTPLLLGHISH